MTVELHTLIYLACFATSALCAALLVRGVARQRARLMFWTAGCFMLLALNNLLVVVDLVVVRDIDLVLWRQLSSLAAVAVLLVGFVWEAE